MLRFALFEPEIPHLREKKCVEGSDKFMRYSMFHHEGENF